MPLLQGSAIPAGPTRQYPFPEENTLPFCTRCSENHNNTYAKIGKSAVWNFLLCSGAIWRRKEKFEHGYIHKYHPL